MRTYNQQATLSIALLLLPTAFGGFFPFLGCSEDNSYGVPTGQDCYAADSYICPFAYSTGCRQVTGSYVYYIGGERRDGGESFEEEVYQSVVIESTINCGGVVNNRCTVAVDGVACNSCTNGATVDNYKRVTLTDCSNIPGVFATTGSQTIELVEGGGHLKLAVNETRCQHPAVDRRRKIPITGELVYNMDNDNPSQQEMNALVVASEGWFQQLLADSFPLFQVFQWSAWRSRFGGGGTVGTTTIMYNATVIFDPLDEATTVQQLSNVMTNTTHMEWYVITTVRTSIEAFEGVETATMTVAPYTV